MFVLLTLRSSFLYTNKRCREIGRVLVAEGLKLVGKKLGRARNLFYIETTKDRSAFAFHPDLILWRRIVHFYSAARSPADLVFLNFPSYDVPFQGHHSSLASNDVVLSAVLCTSTFPVRRSGK